MATDNKELAKKIEAKQGVNPVQAFLAVTDQLQKQYGPHLKSLLGTDDDGKVAFLIACLKDQASKIPKLLEASPQSLKTCLVYSAQMNLFPGAMQECAYVPFFNGRSQKFEATFMPMYQGLIKLAYNSGFVKSIGAEVVYENDFFSYELGTNQHLKHVPFLDGDRGKRKCVWCVVKPIYGNDMVRVLPIAFIEAIRGRSKAAKMSDSPWNDNSEIGYDAMARKTAIKQALKFIPKSAQLQQVISLDDEVEGGTARVVDFSHINSENSVAIDFVDEATGEVTDGK